MQCRLDHTEATRAPDDTGPQPGDIFVSRDGDACYTVLRLPQGLPIVRESQESALALARVVAAYHIVDVWYREGEGLRRVETHRPVPA